MADSKCVLFDIFGDVSKDEPSFVEDDMQTVDDVIPNFSSDYTTRSPHANILQEFDLSLAKPNLNSCIGDMACSEPAQFCITDDTNDARACDANAEQ